MSLLTDITARAAQFADEVGMDIDAALQRWCEAGGQDGGAEAAAWLSVAFLFGRTLRETGAATPA